MPTLDDLTVVVPTYNRNQFLVKLLQSISPEVQNVTIRDNGGYVTQNIIDKFSSYKFKSNINVIPMLENWNKCIDDVKSQYFIIPSDDDLFLEDSFIKVQNAFKKFPHADIYIFGHKVINEKDNAIGKWIPNSEIEYKSPFGFEVFKYGVDARFPSIIFKTNFVRKIGKFDESYVYVAGDSLLIQKCLLYGTSVYVNDLLSCYRVWSNNLTSANISSSDWLSKVDRWQDEISIIIKKLFKKNYFNTSNLQDEVYARNLISGLKNLKNSGIIKKIKFIIKNRIPYNANYLTIFKIIKSIFY